MQAQVATLGARRGLLSERLVGDGMGHLEHLNRPDVYSQLHARMREGA